MTKPGTVLKGQVPSRTCAEWDEAVPGFLEGDLAARCGPVAAGQFLLTLSPVDMATGWAVCAGVRHQGEYAVFEALGHLRAGLPIPRRGLDSDNGSECPNASLLRYCQAEGLTLTRARPYRQEDRCPIGQQTWSVVRRLVGYVRFEREVLPALNRVYALARDSVHFCQPEPKQREKTRDGARVRKRYDRAQTPSQRLLASGVLAEAERQALDRQYQQLNPVRLRAQIDQALEALWQLAERSPFRSQFP